MGTFKKSRPTAVPEIAPLNRASLKEQPLVNIIRVH